MAASRDIAAISRGSLVPGELIAVMGVGLSLPPLFDFILAGVANTRWARPPVC